MLPLNTNLLKKFSNKFLGYGNLKSKYWFIGMEPGAPRDAKLHKRFFAIWEERGGKDVDDVKDFHLAINEKHYNELFEGKIKYQKTWGVLIKLIFNFNGEIFFTLEDVKKYQREKLGRLKSDHCLLELLPLPSPSNKDSDWKQLYSNFFRTRKDYEKEYLPKRVNKINSLIKKNQPEFVIFYGIKYRKQFEKIAGQIEFEEIIIKKNKLFFNKYKGTLFLLIPQPSQGVSDEYLRQVAFFSKKIINKKESLYEK